MPKKSDTTSTQPDTSTIGGRIKALRMKRGMSQTALGQLVAIDKSVVCRWESGAKLPSQNMITQIADIFKVSPVYICYGNDHRESNEYLYIGDLTFRQIKLIREVADELRKSC